MVCPRRETGKWPVYEGKWPVYGWKHGLSWTFRGGVVYGGASDESKPCEFAQALDPSCATGAHGEFENAGAT